VAAWINLFNLVPVWQLDGARGFRALTRKQRWMLVAVMAAMWIWTSEGLLFLVLLVAAGRTLLERGAESADQTAYCCFVVLVVLLSLFCRPGGFSLAF
jgi:Zn-dependent protease